MSERLRFCLLTSYYPPYHVGGDAIYVRRLAHALADDGHRVDVIHSLDAHDLAGPGVSIGDDGGHPGVRRLPVKSRWPAASALAVHQSGSPGPYRRQIEDYLERGGYDVLHYHNVSLLGGPEVFRLGAATALKLYTAHEYWLICPTHVLFRFQREPCRARTCWRCTLHARRPPQLWRSGSRLRRSLRSVDCLVMSSRFSADEHRRQGIDRPSVVLPPIVPAVEVDPSGDDPKRPYFVFAGRLEKLKGVTDLVEVFRDFPAADLHVVGDGGEGASLRRRAAGCDNIRFVGAVPSRELPPIFRSAVATLLPSLCYETFGLSAAESLSCGTPVVLRDLGAMRELAEATGAGLIFSDRDGLRAALTRLLGDDRLRREMGRRGKDHARRQWAKEVHLKRYLDLVRGLRGGGEPALIEAGWRTRGAGEVDT